MNYHLRNEMATDVMATSTTNLTLFHQRSNAVSRDQNYPSLLQKLIVQSLIKIEESDVELYCRSEDLATVKKVVGAAVTEYKQIMKTVGAEGKDGVIGHAIASYLYALYKMFFISTSKNYTSCVGFGGSLFDVPRHGLP